MSIQSKKEYLKKMHPRYKRASFGSKSQILDEVCNVCCYNRKYATRLLNQKRTLGLGYIKNKRGPKRKYDDPVLMAALRKIWIATNLPCSKRLKAIVPLWLPYIELEISEETREKLLAISAASIDRSMAKLRSKYNKLGLATTKPGSILKKKIAIKTDQWNEQQPGFLEADTVAHCGTSVAGQFVCSVNCVDIATSWTEQRATWGKGEIGVLEAIKSIENALPFPLKGFDCDNGSEFINWHLHRHFNERKEPINFTRSRPYRKNDNAHIENKNWTHIRQYLGYQRFEKVELVQRLNNLYTTEWRLYFNYFIPSVKLIQKYRERSKIIKKYDPPKTPAQRILENDMIDPQTKEIIAIQMKTLNPFALQRAMKKKIVRILKMVELEEQNTGLGKLSTYPHLLTKKKEAKKKPTTTIVVTF